MNQGGSGLHGVMRVIYFLGLGTILIAFVISAVTNIYEGPSGEEVSSTIRSVLVDEEEEDYNRNLGAIFALLACGLIASGAAALPSTLNGVRAGLLFGGLVVFFTGIAYAGGGSNDWLVAVWSLLGLATLAACASSLEDGSDLALRLRGRVLPASRPPPPPP